MAGPLTLPRFSGPCFPGIEPITGAALAQRRALAPLRPSAEQQPCDVGLFSDQAAQLDLVDLARRALKQGGAGQTPIRPAPIMGSDEGPEKEHPRWKTP